MNDVINSNFDRDRVLNAYHIIFTEEEPLFDDITFLAAKTLQTPFAYFALINSDTHWIKSGCGIDQGSTPREASFCNVVVVTREPLLLRDTLLDERFMDHPAVVSGPQIRSYIGLPLRGYGGMVVGTLCAFDVEPRDWTDEEFDCLERYARQIEIHLENRRKFYAAHTSADLDVETRARAITFSSEQQVLNRRVVHDMRNVLSTVSANISFLEGNIDPIERREIVSDVTEACQNGIEIIRELEDFWSEDIPTLDRLDDLVEETDIDFDSRDGSWRRGADSDSAVG